MTDDELPPEIETEPGTAPPAHDAPTAVATESADPALAPDDEASSNDREPAPIPKPLAAVAGVLASGLALGAGELLSGLSGRIPSLVARVGDIVIDNVPGSVERWAASSLQRLGTERI